jgi:hypothetical protein
LQKSFSGLCRRSIYLFWKKVSVGLEVNANALKHVFNHYRRSKISFFRTFFKTRF